MWFVSILGKMHLGSSKVNDNTDEIGVEDCLSGRVSAKVIGTLQIKRGTEVLSAQQLGGPKSRQILEILLLHLGSAVSKGTLIDMLWMESAPSTAVSTLESYVSVLRRCLQPGQGKRGVLKTATGGYLLDADLIDLDLARFDSLLIRAEQCTGQSAADLLREALAMSDEPLLGNELLPEWAEAERNLHAARVTAARVRAAENALEMGAFGEAISLAQQVVDLDPLNEPAWSVMILAMERVKQPLRGLQAFEQCRRVMDRELGCQPGDLLQQAQRRMLNETSSSNDDFSLVIRALLALENANNGTMEFPPANRSVLGSDGEITLIEAGSIVRGYVERMMTGVAV
ncbi:AfsR/SARP family transcriptional regulator [Paeniglutamicibacter sp. R2-26]|uniref:AfsR/SARP family transcriptional regulator n=1 Tax=Paeniglutamicibacter sp. R2-26 TaxID=3144417 RepID=UPI003EE7FFB2